METLRYTIRTVSSETGLSTHTIRAWEKRYGAIAPPRTDSNRRLYAPEDIERLTLLRLATERGHGIGQVARLPIEELRRLTATPKAKVARPDPGEGAEAILASCLEAVRRLDSEALADVLVRGGILLGASALLDAVIVPFLDWIGRGWDERTVGISHEHMATVVIRSTLDQMRRSLPAPSFAPRILVTTPANQLHEIGALLVATVAAAEGWNVTYLGANLPAGDIVAAARQSEVRAVGLSLVFPENDPQVPEELRHLRASLTAGMPILVGGMASPHYAEVLAEIGATVISHLPGFRAELKSLRWSSDRPA